MDIGWIRNQPNWLIYSHFCSEACCAPASSSSLLWGKAFKLRGENLRGATSSDWQVTLKSLEIIRNQQSSDIHEQPFEHGRIHWQHMQHGDTWTTLDYDFSIYFADTCRKRFDPSTLPGHNEVPSWWYSATRSERHTGSPRPMGRWWTVGTWLHQLFCGKRMMSMTADDMYICIPSGYLT
jgi:hypothetical protein